MSDASFDSQLHTPDVIQVVDLRDLEELVEQGQRSKIVHLENYFQRPQFGDMALGTVRLVWNKLF